jgi:hypothetical protein
LADKSFQFVADTINGEIQEFPVAFTFKCGSVVAVGVEVIRQYTVTDCIESRRVFLIRQGSNVFGSSAFKSTTEFINYVNAACDCCHSICYILINGCFARINGNPICL